MSTRRSASVGHLPHEKKHFVSRNESSSGAFTPDVRCACQYFQSDTASPVDSRPGSKLDFHHESQCPQIPYEEDQRNVHSTQMQFQGMSERRLLAGDRAMQPEPERLSMRSVGKHRSWDQASASVDISFVEKYPELEQTARSRGLVVRSISDDDPHQMPGMQKQRFSSVDRMSRDPETMSMHSVRSLRRISRSPSKQDLYVADLNIAPPKGFEQRAQRSASNSRRPSFNIISPTPLPQMTDRAPSFTHDFSLPPMTDRQRSYSRDFNPIRSTTPPSANDYRKAKPPASLDYMRPGDNKVTSAFYPASGQVLPQHRPIDMSKYRSSGDGYTTTQPTEHEFKPIEKPMDPLQKTVADLEAAKAAHNLEDVIDNIQIHRLSPPLVSEVPSVPINVDQATYISINTQIPVVDINKLIHDEEEKARNRAKSPTRNLESQAKKDKQSRGRSPMRQDQQQRQRDRSPASHMEMLARNDLETRYRDRSPARQMNTLTQESLDTSRGRSPMRQDQQLRQRDRSPASHMEMLARNDLESRYRDRSPARQMNTLTQESLDTSRGRSPMRVVERLAREDQPSRSTLAREEKESRNRAISPTRERLPTDNLQLPHLQYHPLKRGHSPEQQPLPTTSKKNATGTDIAHGEDLKPTYATLVKNFFQSRPKDNVQDGTTRQRSPSPAPSASRFSPTRESSPAPTQSRLSSMFSKEKPSIARERSPSPAPSTSRFSPMRENSPAPTQSRFSSMLSKERTPIRENSPVPAAPTQSRFSSMFSKEKPTTTREKSPSPAPSTSRFSSMISKERTPIRENSPAPALPTQSRFSSMFSKEKPATTREKSPSPAPSALRFSSMVSKERTPIRENSPAPGAPTQSRFSAMFSKEKPATTREKSPSPAPSSMLSKERTPTRENGTVSTQSRISSMFSKEKTPTREKSPAPAPAPAPVSSTSKLMSMFSKEKPTAISVVSGTNAAVSNKAGAEPMSIKVVETFSLKVDEMDQYMAKPSQKQPPPNPPSLSNTPSVPKSFSSREDFAESERLSIGVSEAFAPIIIGRSGQSSSQFLADKHTSQSEMSSQDRGSEIRSWSKEPTMHSHPELQGKPLFSAAIMMNSSDSINQSQSPDRRRLMHGVRSPSEQRPLLQYTEQKGDFFDGRTQSTDRQRLGGSQDNLYAARMTKTVSFNFDERKSRLTQFESAVMPKKETKHEQLERTYFSRDHEYEPIGTPSTEEKFSDNKDVPPPPPLSSETHTTTTEIDPMQQAEEIQRELEDRFFTSLPKTPQMEIEVDAEDAEESLMDEDLPLKSEKKGFMASAQDRTRKMQAGFKNQAGKLKTKLKPAPKKIPSGSPTAKERKRFKAPEFSKIKMPEMKKPDMSKLKDFKRPEFTKFSKPDMSKFKLPEKITNMKLGRSKSFKESETTQADVDMDSEEAMEGAPKVTEAPAPQKKLFEFNFGTYPRALRKKKKPVEVESSLGTGTATEATSVIPTSTETQPSFESSSSPQGDRGPGPVRSRWADKFSDVSYNDSEGSRYRRYGSEQESFDRESSMERRMREDIESTASEERNMGILSAETDNKQFAEFDEENRAIHEISNLRSGEFKRRPMVHQESDVRSEDSKEDVGWTERDIQKNTLLRKAEMEAEASYLKYQSDDVATQETHSTASSGKKVVLEEIGDDEFFLRKRGISQDNSDINQYIRNAFRDGYDKPINALQHVGHTSDYGDYDVPPPKPRRLHKNYTPQNESQEFDTQRSDYGDDFSVSHNGSDYFTAPRRPMRKGTSRSKYSMESQDVDSRKYMDEEYLRDPSPMNRHEERGVWNDLNMSEKENIPEQRELDDNSRSQPQPPRRQKRQRDTSMEKDSYINGFGGRSVSNTFLQPTEDVIVYRTEHEYHHIPIATPDKYSDTASTRKSVSNYDFDERNSRGAISFEQNEDADETDKYVIDMMENDGYAVVRKEQQVPKPTPPARRKKFPRSPGERFATMPNMRSKRNTPPPPERPPPPRGYTPVSDVVTVTVRKSALSLDAQPNYEEEDDYEEPGRPESPRNLQTGEIINKMKYRPLPPPPRPPREKRQRSASKGSELLHDYPSYDSQDVVDGSSFDQRDEMSDTHFEEVEAGTQTDPLPDDFVCEEFEITDDMKVIEPRIRSNKTIEDMLDEEMEKELNVNHQFIDSEQLAKGLQRFRDANQRSNSERSRASSQADRSKSLSRPQTPSAIVVERQSSTPVLKDNSEIVEATLVVRPIDDLELEEAELRREGLLTDSSQQSLTDTKEDFRHLPVSEASYAPSSAELDEALGILTSDPETQQTDEEVERTLQRYRDELDAIGRELMEAQTTSQEPSPSVSREEIKEYSDREVEKEREKEREIERESWASSDREEEQRSDLEEARSDLEELLSEAEYREESMLSEIKEEETEDVTISEDIEIPAEAPPQPPPRRKSTTAIEQTPPLPPQETLQQPTTTTIEKEEVILEETKEEIKPLETFKKVKQEELASPPMPPLIQQEQLPIDTKELAPIPTEVKPLEPVPMQFPAHIADLEVERLRVHALQAGQIMVSQLHGQQISSDELQCKSGNLVVQNIELPAGLIENIVERVRQTERAQHLTAETQTSLQNSSEQLSSSPVREVVPPPKPPRLRDLEATAARKALDTTPATNADEQTQTEQTPAAATLPASAMFPSAEYLQSLAPLAFYNLNRAAAAANETNLDIRPHPRHHHHHRRRHSSSSEIEDKQGSGEEAEELPRRRRTRSTHSTHTPTSSDDNENVSKAGRKFITACSLSLCKVINQLSDYLRGREAKEGVEEETTDIRNRQVPAMAVLFIVITFVILIFLMTGRSVHTHHWDYFNPPGQEGR